MNKINLRASSLNTFLGCPKQWYNVFILGKKTIPNSRAMIGTGIHKAVEVMWLESIKDGTKNPNLSKMNDAGVEAFDKQIELSGKPDYGDDLDANNSKLTIIKGINAFVKDIVPYTPIPAKVEQRFYIEIDNPYIKKLSGTIDYIAGNTIGDIKTSKRKVVPDSHKLQQSIYKILANKAGHKITRNIIQGVVLAKTKTVGGIDEMDTNIKQAKFIVNNLLNRLNKLYEGKIDPDILFPGNPKYYLCNPKYCNMYSTCNFINGE